MGRRRNEPSGEWNAAGIGAVIGSAPTDSCAKDGGDGDDALPRVDSGKAVGRLADGHPGDVELSEPGRHEWGEEVKASFWRALSQSPPCPCPPAKKTMPEKKAAAVRDAGLLAFVSTLPVVELSHVLYALIISSTTIDQNARVFHLYKWALAYHREADLMNSAEGKWPLVYSFLAVFSQPGRRWYGIDDAQTRGNILSLHRMVLWENEQQELDAEAQRPWKTKMDPVGGIVTSEWNGRHHADVVLAAIVTETRLHEPMLLSKAAEHGYTETVKALLAVSPDPFNDGRVQVRMQDVIKVLNIATAKDDPATFQILMGLLPADHPLPHMLQEAIQHDSKDIVEFLCSLPPERVIDFATSAPLLKAVEKRNVDIVRLLLDLPANRCVDAAVDGNAPLLQVIKRGSVDIVRSLIDLPADRGVDVSCKNNLPLRTAVNGNFTAIVELLLGCTDRGVDPTASQCDVLMSAIKNKNLRLFKLLLARCPADLPATEQPLVDFVKKLRASSLKSTIVNPRVKEIEKHIKPKRAPKQTAEAPAAKRAKSS